MTRIAQRPALLIATGLLGAAVIVAGVLTAGSALAGSPDGGTPTPTPTGSPSAKESPDSGVTGDDGRKDGRRDWRRGGSRMGGLGSGGALGLRMLAGRTLHGEVVLEQEDGSGTEVMLGQRGTVTAKTDTSLSVRSSDGYAVTWTLNDETKVRAASGSDGGGIDDVAVGDEVAVGGLKTSGGGTAGVVVEPGAWPGHGRHRPGVDGDRDGGSTPGRTTTTQA